MPQIQKLFKDVRPGEAFSCDYEHIIEKGYKRPWLYLRIGSTDQAIFLPTGMAYTISPNKRVIVTKIRVSPIA